MQFYTKRKRIPSVIIVSMIDVMVMLLFFFMLTTSFKRPKPEVQLKLPESRHALDGSTSKDLPLILTIDPQGRIFLKEQPVTLKDLPDRLRRAKADNPTVVLELRADEKTTYGLLMKVMDALRDAQIDNIQALTSEPAQSTATGPQPVPAPASPKPQP